MYSHSNFTEISVKLVCTLQYSSIVMKNLNARINRYNKIIKMSLNVRSKFQMKACKYPRGFRKDKVRADREI